MAGLSSSSKNIACFTVKPFLVDRYSCAYLLKQKLIEYDPVGSSQLGIAKVHQLYSTSIYLAYEYLVSNLQLFLVDGHKFGSEFLAYEHNPDSNHATYLVFLKGTKINNPCPLDHILRLAGICKKQALLLTITQEDGQLPSVAYEKISPKMVIQGMATQQEQPTCTDELVQLKRLLGYQIT
jgi:hypothetical protein